MIMNSHGDEEPLRWATEYFALLDRGVPDDLLKRMTDDVTVIHGNNPPIQGHASVRASMTMQGGPIKSISHQVIGAWQAPDRVIAEWSGTYEFADGRIVVRSGVNFFHLDSDDKIRLCRIFMDNSAP
jgi:ketosteroid isomerase-like protein